MSSHNRFVGQALHARANKKQKCEQTYGPNHHACGTFGTSAAEQPLVPKASGGRSSGTFGNVMHLSWSILIALVALVGTLGSGILIGRRLRYQMMPAIAAILIIVGLVLHDYIWEFYLNSAASRGWTLLYTVPTAVASVFVMMLALLLTRLLRGTFSPNPIQK
jgi:hypothetical protein